MMNSRKRFVPRGLHAHAPPKVLQWPQFWNMFRCHLEHNGPFWCASRLHNFQKDRLCRYILTKIHSYSFIYLQYYVLKTDSTFLVLCLPVGLSWGHTLIFHSQQEMAEESLENLSLYNKGILLWIYFYFLKDQTKWLDWANASQYYTWWWHGTVFTLSNI